MAKKDLKYFMRDNSNEIVTVPGPESFKDENGEVINLEIRKLSQNEIDKIYDGYTRRAMAVDKRGNPLSNGGEVLWKVEKDNSKAARHLIAEALQFPDLRDKELMSFYNCFDITEMPSLVFSHPDEYQHVMRAVLAVQGLIDNFEDSDSTAVVEEAKN